MKRKPLLICLGCLAALLAVVLLWPSVIGTRPFKHLTAGDIQSVTVELYPPEAQFTLTREEIEKLAPLLNDVVIYRRDDSWRESSGQLNRFTLTLADGTQTTVQDYNPFLIVDGVGWRTKYEPCEALNQFANNANFLRR